MDISSGSAPRCSFKASANQTRAQCVPIGRTVSQFQGSQTRVINPRKSTPRSESSRKARGGRQRSDLPSNVRSRARPSARAPPLDATATAQSSMSLVDARSAAEHDALLARPNALVVTHFWASWCEPCGAMDALMRELAAARPAVTFARVEAEACDALAERYDVSAVPFFTFHRGAEKIDALEGADARALAGRVRQHFGVGGAAAAAASAPAAAAAPAAAEPLDARLKRLTTQTPVVLFMKGDRDEPRCGFSRRSSTRWRDGGRVFDVRHSLRRGRQAGVEGVQQLADVPAAVRERRARGRVRHRPRDGERRDLEGGARGRGGGGGGGGRRTRAAATSTRASPRSSSPSP